MRILLCILLFSITSAKSFNVSVLYWSNKIEGQVAMRKGIEKRVQEINSHAKLNSLPTIKLNTYTAGDGPNGVENQISQMYKVINSQPDLIIVQPTNNAALFKPLKLANKRKIPVIAYDQYILGGSLTSYITSNNYQAGYLNGEYISSKFNNSTVIKVALVEYPQVSSTVERVDGFIDALKKSKQLFKIVSSYRAVEPVGGKRAGLEILSNFSKKGSLDVVFTVNDGGGLSVVEELVKAKRHEILVASVDGAPESVNNVRDSRNTVIVTAQFCSEIGRKSIQAAYEFLQGKSIPKKVLVPTFPVTKETISLYPGWQGDVPRSFKKPWKKNSYWDNSYKSFER